MRIPYFALVTAKTPGFIESFREADTKGTICSEINISILKARSVHCDPNIERDTTTGGPFPVGIEISCNTLMKLNENNQLCNEKFQSHTV